MSSSRFPGKVLAPLGGRPVIDHVLDRVTSVLGAVVATSDDRSDDPLAEHVGRRGIPVFRGSLLDVFERFRRCLAAFPCAWFVRVCADSPRIDPDLLRRATACADRDLDLVTNVFPRTFPRGCSVEMVRAETFSRLVPATADQREHVTKIFYDHPDRYRILNFESDDATQASVNLCVDTPEDLRRLERA